MLPSNIILLVTLTNFEPNPIMININKSEPYQFIAFKVPNFEVQKPVYQKELQIINQPQRGIQEDNDTNEDVHDKVMPWRP